MATKSEIIKRKKELCSYKFRGFSLDRISKILSGKYAVKETTIKQDWYNREEWLGEVFDIDLDKSDLLILDIIAEQKEIKRVCWKMYHDTENDSVKLGSIKQLREVNKDLVEMLQEIGVIKKTADKLELTGKDGGPITFTDIAQKADEWNADRKQE